MTADDFQNTGRLGCSECYISFKSMLVDILPNMQKSMTHKGKTQSVETVKVDLTVLDKLTEEHVEISISDDQGDLGKESHLENLRAQLKDAVDKEEYEIAAQIHKDIYEIAEGHPDEEDHDE